MRMWLSRMELIVLQSLDMKVEDEVVMDWIAESQAPRRQNMAWNSCLTPMINVYGMVCMRTLGGGGTVECATDFSEEVKECFLGFDFERW